MMFFPAKGAAKKSKTLLYDVKFDFLSCKEGSQAEFLNGRIFTPRRYFNRFCGLDVEKMLGTTPQGLFIYSKRMGVMRISYGKQLMPFHIKTQSFPMGFAGYYNSAAASSDDKFRYIPDCGTIDSVETDETRQMNRLAMCGARLVGVKDDFVLLFPPTHEGDFSENERIQLPGKCADLAVLDSKNTLLLGDTVYKLTLSDDCADVKLETVAYGLGETVYGTVSAIDDRVVFAAKNGLQLFYGNKVNRICKWLDEYVEDYSAVTGAYLDGKYYLSCTLNTPFGKKDVTLAIDLKTEKVTQVYGTKYEQLVGGNGRLFAKIGSSIYELTNEPFEGELALKSSVDFCEQKTLKSVYLQHKGKADIVIRTEKGAVKLSVYGNGQKKRYRIGKLAGKTFDVEASFYGDCLLQSLTLEVGGKE